MLTHTASASVFQHLKSTLCTAHPRLFLHNKHIQWGKRYMSFRTMRCAKSNTRLTELLVPEAGRHPLSRLVLHHRLPLPRRRLPLEPQRRPARARHERLRVVEQREADAAPAAGGRGGRGGGGRGAGRAAHTPRAPQLTDGQHALDGFSHTRRGVPVNVSKTKGLLSRTKCQRNDCEFMTIVSRLRGD